MPLPLMTGMTLSAIKPSLTDMARSMYLLTDILKET
jgi:hypothetical protein